MDILSIRLGEISVSFAIYGVPAGGARYGQMREKARHFTSVIKIG
jgi:hypothetical protein